MRVITVRKLLDFTRFIEMKKEYDIFIGYFSSIFLNRVLGVTEYNHNIAIHEKS